MPLARSLLAALNTPAEGQYGPVRPRKLAGQTERLRRVNEAGQWTCEQHGATVWSASAQWRPQAVT